MGDQDYQFLFHGTSLEIIAMKQEELAGKYYRGNAGDPSENGQNIRGEVTSTTPYLGMALFFVDRIWESFDRGERLSIRVGTCSPTILVVTNPQKYKRSPLFGESEVVVYGAIERKDFTTLDKDVQFIVDNFNSFGFIPEGMSRGTAEGIYERLLKINPKLRDYRLVFPNGLEEVDTKMAKLKMTTKYSPETVLDLRSLETSLRRALPPIRLVQLTEDS